MKSILVLAVLVSFAHSAPLDADTAREVIFISDTQQPLWIETLRLQPTRNEEATRMLFRAIERDTTATAVFHLGDFSALGMFDAYWHPFDEFQRSLHIPVHPVPGNHDYYVFPFLSMRQFTRRFPAVDPTWYSTAVGSTVVIALNSNFSYLSDEELCSQHAWYRQRLSACAVDSTVKAVIVICHHPPYTNSAIIGPSAEVQNEFVTPFLENEKCKVFITGHAHTYEHFQMSRKTFLVIGGGGGLLHPMRAPERQVYHDVFSQSAAPRFFHYLECTVSPAALTFTVQKLRDDFSGFDSVDPFTVPLGR
jgi:3',5'-cyclic AMP phosphodiesterase CpdA